MDPKGRRVKICQEEMESLLNLKYRLDHEEAVSSYAEKYQKLGWVLQGVNPQDGTDLGVDFGEGQVAPVPPSCDPEMQESWRWLCPPWEKAPQSPSRSLSKILCDHLTREPQPRPEVSLSWQEVYCLVSPHEPLLHALSASYPSMQSYYQGILGAATAVGLNAPEVLLALLWHAPRGDARQYPEIWGYLQKLVARAQYEPVSAPSPGNTPGKLFLDNDLSLTRETSAGSSGQAADKPGSPGFFQKRLAKPPQPGAAIRTPFSCRKIREGLSQI